MKLINKYELMLGTTLVFSVFAHSALASACSDEALKIEPQFHIPKYLLVAIAQVESGRTYNGVYQSWPWTINFKNKSYYLQNKNEAERLYASIRKQGASNFDAGCMQINYKWHNKTFDFNNAFDPSSNVRYAAQHLYDLRMKSKSWTEATVKYHSRNPKTQKKYVCRVFTHLADLRDMPNLPKPSFC